MNHNKDEINKMIQGDLLKSESSSLIEDYGKLIEMRTIAATPNAGKSTLYHTIKIEDTIESVAKGIQMMYDKLMEGSGVSIDLSGINFSRQQEIAKEINQAYQGMPVITDTRRIGADLMGVQDIMRIQDELQYTIPAQLKPNRAERRRQNKQERRKKK